MQYMLLVYDDPNEWNVGIDGTSNTGTQQQQPQPTCPDGYFGTYPECTFLD